MGAIYWVILCCRIIGLLFSNFPNNKMFHFSFAHSFHRVWTNMVAK